LVSAVPVLALDVGERVEAGVDDNPMATSGG
jgi:hypothetical protein